jgi:undecaprenyl-diphosphatase
MKALHFPFSLERLSDQARIWLLKSLRYVDALELEIVRNCAVAANYRVPRTATRVLNHLGNGWIYIPIAAALLEFEHARAPRIIGAACLAAALAHAIHAVLKRSFCRRRPFVRLPTLVPLTRSLDRYSFPSGHCMTMTSVLVPVVFATPAVWPAAAVSLCMLAGARLISSHHYVSDVIFGSMLGAVVALPFANWLIPP